MRQNEILDAVAAGELQFRNLGEGPWLAWPRGATAPSGEMFPLCEFRRRRRRRRPADAAAPVAQAEAELSPGVVATRGTGNAFRSVHPTTPELLAAAAKHMEDRAKTYDSPGGERNMAHTVEAFNAITGRDLSESEGWLFMEQLKAVRDYRTPGGHADSQEDRIAYAALGAEARRAGR